MCSTYHTQATELHTSYVSVGSIFWQCMHIQNTMPAQQPLSSISSSSQHSSGNPIRRSVSGMKNLLPLKLLSPTSSEEAICSSSAPSHRTTFGMRLSLRVEGRRTSMGEPMQSQCSNYSAHLSRKRDTPMYTAPGTPLPSLAYLTDDKIFPRVSSLKYPYDKAYILNDNDIEETCGEELELGYFQNPVESICEVDDNLRYSYLRNTTRCSELLFQCSGEAMFSDEAAWLQSPLDILNWPLPDVLSATAMDLASAEHSVESWLSDTSSYFDQDGDRLASATTVDVAPAKANVVTLSTSPGLAITIPPRSSSLDKPTPFIFVASNRRDSLFSFTDSPPMTPSGGDYSRPLSRAVSFEEEYQPAEPKARQDLAMTSPPLSPPLAATPSPSPKDRKWATAVEQPSWPLSSNTSQDIAAGILSSLEEWTSNFPSTMLLTESGCMPAIRSQLSQALLQTNAHRSPPQSLLSPFSTDLSISPQTNSLRRRKTTDLAQHRQISSTTTENPPLPAHFPSSSHKLATTEIVSLNRQPIQNIFPTSSNTMQSALYAHVLAYIYVTSSLEAVMPYISLKQRRRNTPYWNSKSSRMSQKAADILGIASDGAGIAPETARASENAKRLQCLQEDIRKCIFCLISVMDDNFNMENMMGSKQHNIELSSGMILLRSLVEVVRCSEERASGFF